MSWVGVSVVGHFQRSQIFSESWEKMKQHFDKKHFFYFKRKEEKKLAIFVVISWFQKQALKSKVTSIIWNFTVPILYRLYFHCWNWNYIIKDMTSLYVSYVNVCVREKFVYVCVCVCVRVKCICLCDCVFVSAKSLFLCAKSIFAKSVCECVFVKSVRMCVWIECCVRKKWVRVCVGACVWKVCGWAKSVCLFLCVCMG